MEFTKDDYVVEGGLKVSVEFIDGHSLVGTTSKVTVKTNWIITEDEAGVAIFSRDNVKGFYIQFTEG